MLNAMAAINPRVTSVGIDGNLFSQDVYARNEWGLPMMFLKGQQFGQGRSSIEEVLTWLLQGEHANTTDSPVSTRAL